MDTTFVDPIAWESLVSTIESAAVIIAVIVGGLWTIYLFRRHRGHETALEIDITVAQEPYGHESTIVFVDTKLTNRGKTKIEAKPKRWSNDTPLPVYENKWESFVSPATLQLRRVVPGVEDQTVVDWYDKGHCVQAVDDIDLVDEYDDDSRGVIFWLEPGEESHLFAVIVLTGGLYMLKVTFIGNRPGEDFWRSSALLGVPDSSQPTDDVAGAI